MKNLNILVALAASFALFGCGGGSNSSSAPANTTTTYNIANKTLSDFASVSIVDSNTGAEYQSGSLSCSSQSSNCTFYYTGSPIKGAETLVFRDAAGMVVGAYVSGFDQAEYEAPIVNAWTTGLYILQKLNQQSADIAALSQDTLEAKLYGFMQNYTSPDGTADYYEEIAAYYIHERSVNGLSLDAFLTRFAERLQSGDAPVASEFGQITLAMTSFNSIRLAFQDLFAGKQVLIRPALANSDYSSCPSGISAFLDLSGTVMNAVQNAFPIAGTVASSVVTLSQTACNSGEPSMTDIMNKLNAIQTSLNALKDNLGQLTTLVADANINAGLSRFRTTTTLADLRGSNYDALVKNSSLLSYIKQKDHEKGDGTLAYVLNKYPGGTVDLLMKSVFADEGLVTQIDALTDEKFNTMVSSIQAKCGNIGTGDIVSLRVQCNLAVSTSMGRLMAAQRIALKIAKDAYAVADAFPDEVLSRYGYSKRDFDPYAKLKAKFDAQLTMAKSQYEAVVRNSDSTQKGYFNTFDGLSNTLLDNMKEVACWNYANDSAAIGQWMKEDNANTEYYVTNCHVGSRQTPTTVRARYFRKIDGKSVGNDDVGNVMGVLVERRYITGDDYWYVGTRKTEELTLRQGTPLFMKVSDIPAYSNYFAINNTSQRSSNVVVPNTRSTVGPNLRFFKSQSDNWEKGVSEWLLNEDGSDWSYNWMRYTDLKGYSYVFYLANKAGSGSYTGLYCVTGDCTISDRINVSYKHGPQGMKVNAGFGWSVDGKWMYERK